jgi:hypothetical protein
METPSSSQSLASERGSGTRQTLMYLGRSKGDGSSAGFPLLSPASLRFFPLYPPHHTFQHSNYMTGSFSSDKKKNNGSQEFIEHASPPTVAVVQDDSHIAADGEDEVCCTFFSSSTFSLTSISLQINRFVWFLSLVVSSYLFLLSDEERC